jgi:uncharacterized membrane protein
VELSLFNEAGVWFLLRWVHLLAGITWIGLLYYFNFVQGEYFKEADGGAKSDVIQKLVPNALWWFRWGAMFTFLSGAAIIGMKHLSGLGIMIGAVLGTLMFLNVWLIIWPNQKIVIASAKQVAGGGEALAEAGTALGKAGLASRTNTLFSIPMLFFMASSVHLGGLHVWKNRTLYNSQGCHPQRNIPYGNFIYPCRTALNFLICNFEGPVYRPFFSPSIFVLSLKQ